MKAKDFNPESLLTPGQAALILGVDPKTVARYARDGKLSFQRTLGGHRRFNENEIREFAAQRGGVVTPKVEEDE